MADDSLEVRKDELPFHPCLTPRGMTWFNLTVLTPTQQKLLNDLKIDLISDNNKYLAKHPEIRAIISLFVQAVIREKPVTKTIAKFAATFFSMSEKELNNKIEKYLTARGEPLKKQGDSAVNLQARPCSVPSSVDELTSLYHHGYYTYMSYTDEASSYEVEAEWSEYEYFADRTSYTGTETEIGRKFDMLFASRASLDEGLEDSTISLTRQYLDFYNTYEPLQLPSTEVITKSSIRPLEVSSTEESKIPSGYFMEGYGLKYGEEYEREYEIEAEQEIVKYPESERKPVSEAEVEDEVVFETVVEDKIEAVVKDKGDNEDQEDVKQEDPIEGGFEAGKFKQ